MLNNITIMGRLCSNPDLRYTQSNTPVASFTLACERDFGAKDGVRPVDFIDCVAWRGTAEFIQKYFHKGSMAIVSGSLQTRKWADRENNQRKTSEVVIDSVYFGESKRRENDVVDTPYTPADIGGTFAELDDGYGGDLPFA